MLIFEIVGWSNSVSEPAFGTGSGRDASVKSKLINLMTSVRTLMRSMCYLAFPLSSPFWWDHSLWISTLAGISRSIGITGLGVCVEMEY